LIRTPASELIGNALIESCRVEIVKISPSEATEFTVPLPLSACTNLKVKTNRNGGRFATYCATGVPQRGELWPAFIPN